MPESAREQVAALRRAAPWLWEPALGACVVGSAALAEACARAGLIGPRIGDIDLAWPLDVVRGEALLRERGVYVATTAANRARGTLALRVGQGRYEVTSFRGQAQAGASYADRLALDLGLRDMTVGALAWQLADDTVVDPLGGLDDWRAHRIVACGDPAARVREHPVRLLRFYRRAHEWGFTLDAKIRALRVDASDLAAIPSEATSAELRAGLLRCSSPGALLRDLHVAGALAPCAGLLHVPLADQRAEATIAALQWATERAAAMTTEDRLGVLVAVWCRDVDVAAIDPALDRLPSLSDARGRRLARGIAALRDVLPTLGRLDGGALADLYEQWFKGNAFAIEPFAVAAAAHAVDRDDTARRLALQLGWLRERCGAVDVGAIWSRLGDNRDAFASAVRDARAQALRQGRPD